MSGGRSAVFVVVLLASQLLVARAQLEEDLPEPKIADTTPKMQWSQNDNVLFIHFLTKCKHTNDVRFTVDRVHFSCPATDGSAKASTIWLREDIVPTNSSCTVSKTRTTCAMQKRFPHWFDRLVMDPAHWGKYVKRDWNDEKNAGEKEGAHEEGDEEAEFSYGNVDMYDTHAKLQKALESNDLLFLFVTYPWCGMCRFAKQRFIAVSREMAKVSPGKFAYVDAREVPSARRLFKPDCSSSCVYHIMRKGEYPYRVDVVAPVDAIIARLRSYEVSYVKDVASVEEALGASDRPALTLVMRTASKLDEPYDGYRSAARALKDVEDIRFALVIDPSAEETTITAYHKEREPEQFTLAQSDMTALRIQQYANATALPVFNAFDGNPSKIDAAGLPILVGFVNPDDKHDAVFTALGKKLRGRYTVVQASAQKFGAGLNHFEFRGDHEALPVFGITPGVGIIDVPKYGIDTPTPLDDAALEAKALEFVAQYERNELPAKFMSAVEKPMVRGQLNDINGRQLHDAVDKKDEYLLVTLYKQAKKGWTVMRPAFEEIAAVFADVPHLTVGSFDLANNAHDSTRFLQPGSADTWHVFLVGDGLIRKYNGPLTVVPLTYFLTQKIPMDTDVAETVEARVQEKIKERREARLKLDKEDAAFYEIVGSMKKENVTADHAIIKFLEKESSGAQVKKGDTVTIRHTGFLPGAKRFTKENLSKTFVAGETGTVVTCISHVVQFMQVGETAYVECAAQLAYGDKGLAAGDKEADEPILTVPLYTPLRYHIEIVSVEGTDASSEL